MKLQCQLKGPGCLGEFEASRKNEKYCEVCKRHAANAAQQRHRKAFPRESKGFKKKKCEYQGGVGLAKTFQPPLGCLGWFIPTSGIQKNCENCMPFALKLRTAKARKKWINTPEGRKTVRAANARHFQKHRSTIYQQENRRAKRRRKVARLIRALRSKPEIWQRIVPLLLLHPDLSNEEVQDLAGFENSRPSKETMRRIRAWCGVRGTGPEAT
jgi:hypothetical protein